MLQLLKRPDDPEPPLQLLAAPVAATGAVLPGFALADALPFEGDSPNATMRWRGGRSAIPEVGSQGGVQVRFALLRARLYGFALVRQARGAEHTILVV